MGALMHVPTPASWGFEKTGRRLRRGRPSVEELEDLGLTIREGTIRFLWRYGWSLAKTLILVSTIAFFLFQSHCRRSLSLGEDVPSSCDVVALR